MGRENTLGFKICFENIDLALAENIARDRKNIIIFMCVNDISQTALGEKLGCNRSTVSKNLNTNINTSSSFKERFCKVFGFNNVELNYDPIVFYYICCERRRNELIQSGLHCAPLYNADYLMQYKFTKKASKEMADKMLADYNNRENSTTLIKKSVNVLNVAETQSENFETVEVSNVVDNHELEIIKRELTDFEVAQISSRYKRKIAKKESFIYFPIALSVYLLIIASIFIVLGFNNTSPEYALYFLLTLPICFVSVKLFANSKIKRYASEFSVFKYEREENYNSKILSILSVVAEVIGFIFAMASIIYTLTKGVSPDDEWIMLLYFTLLTPSLLATIISSEGCKIFKKELTFKMRFYDLLRSIGFYLHLVVTILFSVCVIIQLNGIIVLFFQIPLLILSLLIYIIGKINLSKYKLYEYILDTKIPINQ
jgi:hypothetical protein